MSRIIHKLSPDNTIADNTAIPSLNLEFKYATYSSLVHIKSHFKVLALKHITASLLASQYGQPPATECVSL